MNHVKIHKDIISVYFFLTFEITAHGANKIPCIKVPFKIQ